MTDRQADAAFLAALRERLEAALPRDMPFTLEDEGRASGAMVVRVTVDCGRDVQPHSILLRVDGGDVDSAARSVADLAIRTVPRPNPPGTG